MQQADKQAAKQGPLASVLSLLDTSVGRKLITGLTGLGLVGFIIIHLAGNLSLFFGAEAFNAYAHKLESLGMLIWAAELGLLGVFIFHVIFAIAVTGQNKAARKAGGYAQKGNAGNPSRKSLSSQTMIWTGLILLIFTVVHVAMFKFNFFRPIPTDFPLHGDQVKDLYAIVVFWFQNIWVVLAYVAVMLLLGVHVRHGFWSAFQSLGAYHPRYTPLIYTAGIALAVLLAVGFLALPLFIYFFVKAPAAVSLLTLAIA